MVAPAKAREPHLAYGDAEAVLEEIAQLAGGLGIHAAILRDYARIGHRDGIDLAAKDARDCLVKLLELRKGLSR
jgi:hypothetical protein